MAELILYSNPMSRGRIARWMLEEVGQPYQVRYLDYGAQMKAPEYLAINPMGKVPALVHGDRVVTEYAAICAYLADAFPEAGLAPADRSAYYRWLFFGAGPLEAAIINKALGFTVPEDRRAMVGFGTLETTYAALESQLARTPYLAGEAFSAADVATGSQIGYGLQFGTIEARPAFTDYWERIKERPALLRANAADNAAMKEKEI
ncbi:glutathione S-transferase family protein [Albidovulum sediminicola]|uniref:Glutathione S-transferase family protein n=1 Tax=Albidovulum sediminicola TaxID=2984331 RepID=A0ABT2YZ05_9RHOB|nr:glutathione S-transferase family protein [Defluviimonas sp. WL0075]MCV2864122.1 glutathione S-transferase family protein [Defluviimonas sp. WL0075]